jgi:hypothetical protein
VRGGPDRDLLEQHQKKTEICKDDGKTKKPVHRTGFLGV